MESFSELLTKQRNFFYTGKTKDISYRINALNSLNQMIKSHEVELMNALNSDLNKSEFDSYITEIGILLE